MKLRSLTRAAALVVLCAVASAAVAQKAPAAPTKVNPKQQKTLPGGLKYAILKPGKGAAATAHQTVTVHYTGWLTNGKKFDSSLDRREPFEFALGHQMVIKGWDEGVKGMKIGEKRQLVIPPAMGYGPGGTPDGTIPPNATLIFVVELLKLGPAHRH
jgi:FKBP-type peptidyl-prolyl cis-trans isomerase